MRKDLPCFITQHRATDNTSNAPRAHKSDLMMLALVKHSRETLSAELRGSFMSAIFEVFTPSFACSLARLTFTWRCLCVGFVKIFNVETTKLKKNFVKFSKPKLISWLRRWRHEVWKWKLGVCVRYLLTNAIEPIALTFSIETRRDAADVEETRISSALKSNKN